ncbi:MAG TPA: TetR/AcrR family transcriptional regulator [Acidimicrobiales bacterium]|nr:TetR/AcrR family transcriptional regulator [Acidimicrobiales bacterium]
MTKQSRSAPVMKAVLDAVAERLLDGDELRIRIPEICQATGVNYGSVYHHFGSREGVIDAAYEALFCTHAEQEIARWEILSSAASRESFDAGLRELLDPANHDATRVGRAMTTRIVAAAETRPALRGVVVSTQTRVSDACARALAYGQRQGWLRADATPEAMAGLVEAVAVRYGAQDLVGEDASGQADVALLVWRFLLGARDRDVLN